MQIGAFLNTDFPTKGSLQEALDACTALGLDAVEIGGGGLIPKNFLDPAALLEDDYKRKQFVAEIEKRGLFISAISVHGNMAHPDKGFAEQHRKDFRDSVLLASKIGVERVVTFAGCPGSSDKDKYPNWITCPWPDYFSEALKWQWEQKLIPMWRELKDFCRKSSIKMIALEMHPGDAVFTPEKLLQLRNAVGEEIGCNFDPSHLFWQGIDPTAALRALKDCIFHVHAKDTRIEHLNVQTNGVLDTKPYEDEAHRSWMFRTVGYGHGLSFWKDFVSTLRLIDYDYVISIEHEDTLMSTDEGVAKAVQFLKSLIISEPRSPMWWD
jgi:sugar phosphate isomerase/epimerase